MVVQRWDPFGDLRNMENIVNRLWRGYGGLPGYREGSEDWNILIDVIQRKDAIEVIASMPGVRPEEIEVAVEDNVLTLKAERRPEIEGGEAAYLIRERPTGSFYRALRLPDTVDTDRIKSNYENGVLTITMPKAEEKKKKQIKIQVASGPKVIEAKKEK